MSVMGRILRLSYRSSRHISRIRYGRWTHENNRLSMPYPSRQPMKRPGRSVDLIFVLAFRKPLQFVQVGLVPPTLDQFDVARLSLGRVGPGTLDFIARLRRGVNRIVGQQLD